jgi:hypothetical protein
MTRSGLSNGSGSCQIGTIDITNIPDDTLVLTTLMNANGVANTENRQQPAFHAGNQIDQRSRSIGMIQSGPRTVSSHVRSIARVESSNRTKQVRGEGYLELDSHADTACVGADCRVITYTEQTCEVSLFHPDYKPLLDVPIVQTTTAYTDPENGRTYILIINEALYLGDVLAVCYLNPNQMRAHGRIVDDIPQHLAPDPSAMTHSIFVPSLILRIPLALKEIVSRIVTHYPSTEELQTCEWVELTSSEPWEPSSSLFEENEAPIQHSLDEEPSHNNGYICNVTSKAFEPELNLFPSSIQRRINSIRSQSCSHSSHLKNQVSTVFGVGLETSERTLQATTQLALRSAIHPMYRQFRTKVA